MSACRTAEVHTSPLQVFGLNLSPQILTHKISLAHVGVRMHLVGRQGVTEKTGYQVFWSVL